MVQVIFSLHLVAEVDMTTFGKYWNTFRCLKCVLRSCLSLRKDAIRLQIQGLKPFWKRETFFRCTELRLIISIKYFLCSIIHATLAISWSKMHYFNDHYLRLCIGKDMQIWFWDESREIPRDYLFSYNGKNSWSKFV